MTYELRIYYEDTDAGGVVYYANYLKFAERARTEWLRVLGYEQRTLWHTHGIGFVVKSCHCEYHAPAFLDDTLNINTIIGEKKHSSFTMNQHIMRGDTMIATLSVTLVCVNRDLRPKRLPPMLCESL